MKKIESGLILALLIWMIVMVCWGSVPMAECYLKYFLSGDTNVEDKVNAVNETIHRVNIIQKIFIGF